ncbi:MAG: transporter [Pirellulales bacterium]
MTTHIASLDYHRTAMLLSTVLAASLWCQTKSLLADERTYSYGPNECQSRGTLLQWSYGTSFSGGPNLDEPLVTDRPDFTEASSTVGRGVAQLEFGYTYLDDQGDSERTQIHSYGETLLRLGVLADWLELRFALFPLVRQTTTGGMTDSTGGLADLYLGVKLGLTPQEGILPEMALIPQMFVPSGSNAFTSGQVEPGVNWIYSWEINDLLSTAGSTQVNRRLENSGASYVRVAQSWTLAYSLTDRLGAYTEWFSLIPNGAETFRTQSFFNGGFTFLLSDDVQWDIRAGVGLNDAADDFFTGTGLSIRLR